MSSLPPALRYRVLDTVARFAGGEVADDRLERLLATGTGWLGTDPMLGELGLWLTDARHSDRIRGLGCAWLALFPSTEMVDRLTAIATDPATAPALREDAIEALADRQLRGRHPDTRWPAEAVQLADDTLFKLADAATTEARLPYAGFPIALRHVQSDGLAAVFARAPALWGGALECFATPPLARVLAVSIDDIAPSHRIRVLRLLAATLGNDAVPLLIARASASRSSLDERLESLFLAITLEGEAHVPRLEAVLRDTAQPELARKRARWHLANPGVVPTVRGLRVARVAATLPPPARGEACGRAADDLGALARFVRYEPYLYEQWAWMARGAADSARVRDVVAAHPAALSIVRELQLFELARRGRVRQLVAAAQGCPDLGALQLAIWGRPLAALELAATATEHTAELVCARALACYRAGRPDLADRILAEDLPPAAITDDETVRAFPGPDETWHAEYAGDRRPAIAALVGGRDGVLALANPAHHDAEPDSTSLDGVGEVVRRLRRELRGAAVYLAGTIRPPDRIALVIALERAGARVVAGPVPGTEFYVAGECSAQMLARLERSGVRRLDAAEIGVT